MYWALFTQIDSSWTFQSSQLNTTVLGFKIEPDQAKAVGALLLLFLIPFWQNIVNPLLAACNVHISPLKSIVMGGISAAMAFLCAAMLQIKIEEQPSDANKLSILWQLPQFIMIMFGEVWLSIPGLTFAFTQSPLTMRSVMTAAWFCNNAFGNLIVVAITELQPFALQSNGYFLYAGLMFVSMLLFCWLARNYEYSNYEEVPEINGNDLKRSNQSMNSQDTLDLMF